MLNLARAILVHEKIRRRERQKKTNIKYLPQSGRVLWPIIEIFFLHLYIWRFIASISLSYVEWKRVAAFPLCALFTYDPLSRARPQNKERQIYLWFFLRCSEAMIYAKDEGRICPAVHFGASSKVSRLSKRGVVC